MKLMTQIAILENADPKFEVIIMLKRVPQKAAVIRIQGEISDFYILHYTFSR